MEKEKAKIKFSPRILDHLGISAYNSLKKCLAELCTNSYDADASEVKIVLPDIINDSSVIYIEDNGHGISKDELKEKYLYIGYNRRNDGEKTKKGRDVIGSKGIGKLAGFGISDSMKIATWKDNIQSSLMLDKKNFENVSNIGDSDIEILVEKTKKKHGTKIILRQLNGALKIPDENELREHLYRVLPLVSDFKILVNGVECTAADIKGDRHEISAVVDGVHRIEGYYKIAEKRQTHPGIAIRVRKRVVTEPSLFGLEKRSHFSFGAERIVGEIEADFLDPLINTSRDSFLVDSEIVQNLNSFMNAFLLKVVDGIEKKAEDNRSTKIFSMPAIQKRLDELPPHVRSTARKVLSSVISKLKNVDDAEAEELINWIIRYYESNVLRELMNAIVASGVDEIERLSNLIQDWGLKQINSVTELIKNQIEIIEKLEEAVISNKTLEMELHRLIEKNLWLVKEGLELWGSDKPLKTLLDGHAIKLYKNKMDLKPDIVCRSRDDGLRAVILEFKRPKEKIMMEHVAQALAYKGLIKKHRPNLEYETYVIGREFDSSVLATKDDLDKAGLHMWGFEEILQQSRARFESILEILDK
jgi:hypothetical protein